MLPSNLELITAPNSPAALTCSAADERDFHGVKAIVFSASGAAWRDHQDRDHAIAFGDYAQALRQIRPHNEIHLCALNDKGIVEYRSVPVINSMTLTPQRKKSGP